VLKKNEGGGGEKRRWKRHGKGGGGGREEKGRISMIRAPEGLRGQKEKKRVLKKKTVTRSLTKKGGEKKETIRDVREANSQRVTLFRNEQKKGKEEFEKKQQQQLGRKLDLVRGGVRAEQKRRWEGENFGELMAC